MQAAGPTPFAPASAGPRPVGCTAHSDLQSRGKGFEVSPALRKRLANASENCRPKGNDFLDTEQEELIGFFLQIQIKRTAPGGNKSPRDHTLTNTPTNMCARIL